MDRATKINIGIWIGTALFIVGVVAITMVSLSHDTVVPAATAAAATAAIAAAAARRGNARAKVSEAKAAIDASEKLDVAKATQEAMGDVDTEVKAMSREQKASDGDKAFGG